jgi:hypothetical protein
MSRSEHAAGCHYPSTCTMIPSGNFPECHRQHCATAWLVHRYHLQKLTVPQLLKKFSEFNTVFTTRQLSWATLTHSILFLQDPVIIVPSISVSSKCLFPLCFPPLLLHTFVFPLILHAQPIYHTNNIWSAVPNRRPPKFSPLSYYIFLPARPKYPSPAAWLWHSKLNWRCGNCENGARFEETLPSSSEQM